MVVVEDLLGSHIIELDLFIAFTAVVVTVLTYQIIQIHNWWGFSCTPHSWFQRLVLLH